MTKPIKQKRIGLVSASLFEREVEGQNGPFKSQSVALNISYPKGNGFEQNSITIIKKNLMPVIKVLQEIAGETPAFSENYLHAIRDDEAILSDGLGMCEICSDVAILRDNICQHCQEALSPLDLFDLESDCIS